MEQKYSKGNWLNDGFYNGRHLIGIETVSDYITIAEVIRPIHDSPKLTKEQAKANAQLVSAAPDLLEALQLFINAHAGPTEAYEKGKAAIAKALGNG